MWLHSTWVYYSSVGKFNSPIYALRSKLDFEIHRT